MTDKDNDTTTEQADVKVPEPTPAPTRTVLGIPSTITLDEAVGFYSGLKDATVYVSVALAQGVDASNFGVREYAERIGKSPGQCSLWLRVGRWIDKCQPPLEGDEGLKVARTMLYVANETKGVRNTNVLLSALTGKQGTTVADIAPEDMAETFTKVEAMIHEAKRVAKDKAEADTAAGTTPAPTTREAKPEGQDKPASTNLGRIMQAGALLAAVTPEPEGWKVSAEYAAAVETLDAQVASLHGWFDDHTMEPKHTVEALAS